MTGIGHTLQQATGAVATRSATEDKNSINNQLVAGNKVARKSELRDLSAAVTPDLSTGIYVKLRRVPDLLR